MVDWWSVLLCVVAMVVAGALCWAEVKRRRFSHIPSLEGKHVVITGGSSGIGLCIATQCAAEGAFLTLMARSPLRLEAARRHISSSAGVPQDSIRLQVLDSYVILKNFRDRLSKACFWQSVDVGDAGAVALAIHEAFAWRPVDVLVCSAGILEANFFADVKPSRLEEITRTNLLGVVFPVQSAIPLMQARSRDHPSSIVIVGSLSACVFLYGSNMYTPTKAALKGFAEALKFELLPFGIGVTISYPAFTQTPMLEEVEEEATGFVEFGKKIYLGGQRESPQEVARCTIEGFMRNEFFVSTTYQGVLVRVIGRGFVAPDSFPLLLLELLLIIPMRLLTFLWVKNARHVLLTSPVPSKKKTQ